MMRWRPVGPCEEHTVGHFDPQEELAARDPRPFCPTVWAGDPDMAGSALLQKEAQPHIGAIQEPKAVSSNTRRVTLPSSLGLLSRIAGNR